MRGKEEESAQTVRGRWKAYSPLSSEEEERKVDWRMTAGSESSSLLRGSYLLSDHHSGCHRFSLTHTHTQASKQTAQWDLSEENTSEWRKKHRGQQRLIDTKHTHTLFLYFSATALGCYSGNM